MKAKHFIFLSILFVVFLLAPLLYLPHSGVHESISRKSLAIGLALYWLILTPILASVINLKKHWREITIALFAVVFSLSLIELGLGQFELFPEKTLMNFYGVASREYHHGYPPNKKMYKGLVDGKKIVVKTNQDGLRSSYTRDVFSRYKNRVVIIGDSFTFGVGVRQDATFPALVETHLRNHLGRADVAVLNAGIISFSPFLEHLLLTGRLLFYAPTTVLLFLDATDIGDDYIYQEQARYDHGRIYFDVPREHEEAYYGTVVHVLSSYLSLPVTLIRGPKLNPAPKFDYYNFRINIEGIVESNRFFIYRHPLASTRSYFQNTESSIQKIAQACKSSGARFVLIVAPRFHHWNQNECPKNWENDPYSLNEPFQFEYFKFFHEVADQQDFPTLDLLPAFKKTKEFPLVFENDPHWNEKGHAFVARIITDYVLENHMVE